MDSIAIYTYPNTYLIKHPPEDISTKKSKTICKGVLMHHIILDIVRMGLTQLVGTIVLAGCLKR